MRRRGGFTLIEVIIAIAIISILASMAVPYAARLIDMSREESTKREMEGLYTTIMGDPKVPTGGYVGDMGRLPNNLADLNTRGGQRNPSTGFLGVRFGWNGPYVNSGFDPQGYLNDGWGTAYFFGNTGGGPPATRLRAASQDRRMNTADDLVYPYPPNSFVIGGNLLVNLYVWDNAAGQYRLNPSPAQVTQMWVRFYYSNNGREASVTVPPVQPPAVGPPYAFNGYHLGLHAVEGSCRLAGSAATATGQAVVYVPGDNRQAQMNLYLR